MLIVNASSDVGKDFADDCTDGNIEVDVTKEIQESYHLSDPEHAEDM